MTATPFHRTYDDTLALLVEARAYVAHRQREDEQGLSARQRVRVGFETLRITTRLTQAMAWLLAERAVQSGELEPEALSGDAYALDARELCLDATAVDDESLPSGLRRLSERSLAIYRRVDRLEQAARAALD